MANTLAGSMKILPKPIIPDHEILSPYDKRKVKEKIEKHTGHQLDRPIEFALYPGVLLAQDPIVDMVIADLKADYPNVSKDKVKIEIIDGMTYFFAR